MSPPIFVMNGIEIYIDESGDFGPFDERCPFYIVTMVFHEMIDNLYSQIQELEYCLSLLGLEDHCIHSSPAIRGEDEYYGTDVVLRRKVMSNFAGFVRRTNLRYKCFFIRKQPGSTEEKIVQSLREVFDPFFLHYFDRLAAYSLITVAYDKGQKLLSSCRYGTAESEIKESPRSHEERGDSFWFEESCGLPYFHNLRERGLR